MQTVALHLDSGKVLSKLKSRGFRATSLSTVYRVTDEALIAETTVWPNFFLMNIFFALKGSKLFIIIANMFVTHYYFLMFALSVKERQDKLLRCIGCLSFTKDRIKLDSLSTLALALLQNCLNY